MNDLRKLIDIFEDPSLKKEIIDAIKKTDDIQLLQRILNSLTVGDLPARLKNVLSKDVDARKFTEAIARVIMSMDASNAEKISFVDNYTNGFINTDLLLDGKQHNYREFINDKLAMDLFKIDMAGVRRAIETAWVKSKNTEELVLPDRTNINYFLNNIRPNLDPKLLPKLAKSMADGMFKHVNNQQYVDALINGDLAAIQDAILTVGFDNYKAYSDFDGILLVDVPSETAQYFRNYAEMRGHAKAGQGYVYAPESEAMPQVDLIPEPGVGTIRGEIRRATNGFILVVTTEEETREYVYDTSRKAIRVIKDYLESDKPKT
ncbi:MAG: hypothetical protein EBT86_09375 [Actinobacteria bacterium]|nr:hypothetical protein [Actinomycetota bacterium]